MVGLVSNSRGTFWHNRKSLSILTAINKSNVVTKKKNQYLLLLQATNKAYTNNCLIRPV